MTMSAGLTETDRRRVPNNMRMMLPLAIERSLEAVLASKRVALVFEGCLGLQRTNVAMKGNTTVNSNMFTPARKESRSSAYTSLIASAASSECECKHLPWEETSRIFSTHIAEGDSKTGVQALRPRKQRARSPHLDRGSQNQRPFLFGASKLSISQSFRFRRQSSILPLPPGRQEPFEHGEICLNSGSAVFLVMQVS